METEIRLQKIRSLIAKIKADCEQLREAGELTERGKGQLDTVAMIEEILMD